MAPYYFYLLGAYAVLFSAISPWVSGALSPPPYPYSFPPPKPMQVIHQWKYIDYAWKSEEDRHEAIRNGTYIPANCIPLGLAVWRDRTVVTTPRNRPGVPATLSFISNRMRNGENVLDPFPSFELNREGNCKGLTSTYGPAIDEVGRLWALDSGVVNVVPTIKPVRRCPPKVMIFDLLNGDKLVGTFVVPEKLLFCNSVLQTIVVDIRNGQGHDAWAYITDVIAYQMLVFSLKSGRFHSVSNPASFFPVPKYITFVVAGTTVTNTDGLVSIALGRVEKRPDGSDDRRVYYHPFSGLKEYFVMASTIRDAAAYTANPMAYPKAFYQFPTKRESRTPFEVLDVETGVMFANQVSLNSIVCWNTVTDYYMSNTATVAQNDTTMQYVLGTDFSQRNLYVLSTRIQYFLQLHNLIDITEINFRILVSGVYDLIRGTPCDVKYAPACEHCSESPTYTSNGIMENGNRPHTWEK